MNPEELEILSRPKMQAFLREKMGEWQRGDRYIIKDEVGSPVMHYSDLCDSCEWEVRYPEDVVRLPLPIDPRNPERGLWGMIDWTHAYARASEGDGNLLIETWGEDLGRPRPVYGSPAFALLKALWAQIGGK